MGVEEVAMPSGESGFINVALASELTVKHFKRGLYDFLKQEPTGKECYAVLAKMGERYAAIKECETVEEAREFRRGLVEKLNRSFNPYAVQERVGGITMTGTNTDFRVWNAQDASVADANTRVLQNSALRLGSL